MLLAVCCLRLLAGRWCSQHETAFGATGENRSPPPGADVLGRDSFPCALAYFGLVSASDLFQIERGLGCCSFWWGLRWGWEERGHATRREQLVVVRETRPIACWFNASVRRQAILILVEGEVVVPKVGQPPPLVVVEQPPLSVVHVKKVLVVVGLVYLNFGDADDHDVHIPQQLEARLAREKTPSSLTRGMPCCR